MVKGMLWRGHANQGRCQPGRRAVLEETKELSYRSYSTLGEAFSQGNFLLPPYINFLVFIKLQVPTGLPE
jgi:hypothetical protein